MCEVNPASVKVKRVDRKIRKQLDTNALSAKNSNQKFYSGQTQKAFGASETSSHIRLTTLYMRKGLGSQCTVQGIVNARYKEKYNTPLPSSAPAVRLFSFAMITNSPKANRLNDKISSKETLRKKLRARKEKGNSVNCQIYENNWENNKLII
ncbi:hypothetical protein WN51_13314 [Melipona quadrifasciata]|uniref:Uncharacterized protein n=1 Tax=Melipona quadrifasciata TaxID=166423 RepID=A0A0M9A3L7_9HYME|nr:hypothetical protein WN51_13314 [Melipona quadrifasciata]